MRPMLGEYKQSDKHQNNKTAIIVGSHNEIQSYLVIHSLVATYSLYKKKRKLCIFFDYRSPLKIIIFNLQVLRLLCLLLVD